MNTKFELPEGKWLVTIKNGQTKIRNMEGRITLDESRFLELKSKSNEASKLLSDIKSLI